MKQNVVRKTIFPVVVSALIVWVGCNSGGPGAPTIASGSGGESSGGGGVPAVGGSGGSRMGTGGSIVFGTGGQNGSGGSATGGTRMATGGASASGGTTQGTGGSVAGGSSTGGSTTNGGAGGARPDAGATDASRPDAGSDGSGDVRQDAEAAGAGGAGGSGAGGSTRTGGSTGSGGSGGSAGTSGTTGQCDATTTPVARHGRLSIKDGKLVNQCGRQVQFTAMSLYDWSQQGRQYYNATAVKNLFEDKKCTTLRIPLIAADYPSQYSRVKTVLDACIATGIYCIPNWHVIGSSNVADAKAFHVQIAKDYGNSPNIIHEPWNEPTTASWSQIKSYMEEILAAVGSFQGSWMMFGEFP
jgi:hypothetical protein